MQRVKRMYRQGDILLVEVVEIPKNIKKRDTRVIVEGEMTGHAHRMINGEVFDSLASVFVVASNDARLVHDEHGPINILPGTYQVIRQREYEPRESESRSTRIVSD